MIPGEEGSFVVAEALLLNDHTIWKELRKAWMKVIIDGMLKEYDSKVLQKFMYWIKFSIRASPFQLRFSRILAKTYKGMMDNYIVDRQESDTSIVNLTVQIFSVKSIAHILFEEENLLAKVVDFYRDLVDRKYASGLKPLRVKTGMESN